MTTTSSRALWRFTCALLTLLTLLALSLAETSAQTPTSTRSVSEQSGYAVTWGAPQTLASTASGTANLIFDPNVTVKDRELITESVQLAEGFFAARFGVAMGAEVTVTALPIPSPLDPYLTAATYGNSIVIYTRSLGWLESPPAERLRVVIHEYTHVYQYLRTADHPFESAAWFEEGVAEYLSTVAVSELGLMDRNAREGYYGSVVTYVEMPALQDLEGYSVMQAQSGEIYHLMYFGVAQLMLDLPLTAIDTYYTGLQQGTSFALAFEHAFGITPADYYAEFAQFRDTGLPDKKGLPEDLEPIEENHAPSQVTSDRLPLLVIAGEQVLIVAESSQPGANCTLDLTTADGSVLGESRETNTNAAGQVFWLVTIPNDLPNGRATIALACGADPLLTPVLVF